MWVVDLGDVTWIRVANPRRDWYQRLLANPHVELERGGRREPRLAIPDPTPEARLAVDEAFAAKYGLVDRWYGLLVRREAVPIRLVPQTAGSPDANSGGKPDGRAQVRDDRRVQGAASTCCAMPTRSSSTGPRAVDDPSVLEGYRWLTEILSVALDCYLWADDARPTIVPIVGPTRKFGGDNADAMYTFAPLHPERSYRVRGVRGDACYLSLTVYGGPRDGRWSDRIVATLNDRSIRFEPDGSFEVRALRARAARQLDPARSGQRLPDHARLSGPPEVAAVPASFAIECLDEVPPPRLSDEDLARRFHAAANFIRDMLKITPLPLDRVEAEPDRRALSGAAAHLRLGGGRRGLRDGELRARPGRGARARRTLAALRLLERLPLESVPADLRLPLRAGDAERRAGAATSRTAPGGS